MPETRLASPRGTASPGNIPKSPFASGNLEDAKFVEFFMSLAGGETKELECDAMAFYIDAVNTNNLNELYFTLDDCFPFCTFKAGFFFRLRPFTRLKIKNTTGLTRTVHGILSRNPEFLVMQFTP